MTDLLIRNIDPELKRQLEERARQHKRSLSEEAKMLLHIGLKRAGRAAQAWNRNVQSGPAGGSR